MKIPRNLSLMLAVVLGGCQEAVEPTVPRSGTDLPITAAVDGSRMITLSPSDALNSTLASPFSVGTVVSPFGPDNYATKTLTVTNSGTRTTSAISVSWPGAPFAITDDQCTGRSLGVVGSKKSSCTLTVTFTPNSTGAFTATLTISIAQPKATLTVYLSGTAQDLGYTISGRVFIDQDFDGNYQPNTDIGADGYEVILKDQSGTTILQNTTTGTEGTYAFGGVSNGSYQVAVTTLTGDVLTTQNPILVNVTSADRTGILFGFFRVSSP